MVGRRDVPAAVAGLVFASGCCALVYQVTWLRELRLVFGASTPASAAVLAVFMGGLGWGGLVLGRRAERAAHPLALYGWLEVGVAVAAGLSPWSIALVRGAYYALGGTASLGTFGGTLLRLLLTALVLGVPTFLMGGTLPAVGRAVTRASDAGRRSLGWLYGCNTLGAVTGATLSTFLLMEALGQRKSLWVAALVNLLVGWLAIRRGHRESPATPVEASTPAAAVTPPGAAAAPLPLVLLAAAMVGFAYFLMELVWYRLLSPLLGGSTYTFGTILLVALAGIGIGGLLYGATGAGRPARLASFATTCALEALLLIVPLALAHRLAVLTISVRSLESLGFAGLTAGWLLIAGLVVLPASIVAGYQFPLLVALLGSGRREVAWQTGLVTACNTGGAIAGSLAGGFGLLPLLGAPGAWRAATVLLAGLGLLGALLAWREERSGEDGAGGAAPRRRRWLPALASLAAVALCLAPGPGTMWRHSQIGAGRAQPLSGGPNELRDRLHREERALLWATDGRESGVALHGGSGYAFSINGKIDGHVWLDSATQVMLPLVGAMLHPAPRRTLVIGLGTGSSAGWAAAVPGMSRVDVVELEPAVVEVARVCTPVNHGALADPRVRLWLGDGREYLLTRDQQWDLIVSEPSNPFRAGIASLFTSEFYRAAADRLAPGGIFVQWLQAYEVDAEVVASVYVSLADAFPYVETWSGAVGDLLLVAAAEPIVHDLTRVRRRAAAEPFRSALADSWGVWGAEGFYSGLLAGPGFARRMAASGAPPNLDDRPVLEFGFARSLGQRRFSIDDVRQQVRPEERTLPGLRELRWDLLPELWDARVMLSQRALAVEPGLTGERLARALARVAAKRGDSARAAVYWDEQSEPPLSLVDQLLLAEGYAERADPRAPAVAHELLADRPVEAHAVLARWHLRRGDTATAASHLERSLAAYRHDPWAWQQLMGRALELTAEVARDATAARRMLAALEQPFSAAVLEELRKSLRVRLALLAGGDACREPFNALEPYPDWDETFLRQRLTCYRQTGDPLAARARRDLDRFIAARPLTLAEQLSLGAAAATASAR